MNTFSKLSIALFTTFLSMSTLATANTFDRPCGAHTWHTIYTNQEGWKGTLQMINQVDHAWFMKPDCSKLNTFSMNATQQTQKFGFAFDEQADFDVAYTLTLVQNNDAPSFTSKACVFIVTAKGPAQPDVTVKAYNGAKCDWKVVHGVGEDFYAE